MYIVHTVAAVQCFDNKSFWRLCANDRGGASVSSKPPAAGARAPYMGALWTLAAVSGET